VKSNGDKTSIFTLQHRTGAVWMAGVVEVSLIDPRQRDPEDLHGSISDQRPLAKHSLSSHSLVQIGHYINTLGALALALYFTYYRSFRSLQYFQISFVSVLLLLLERRHTVYQNYFLVILGLIIGAIWNVVITLLFYNELPSSSSSLSSSSLLTLRILSVTTSTSSCTLILSWIWYAYKSKPINVDIDLMLYFLAMNIIAFFSADQFNNTLHFLIDIRTYQLIFTAALCVKSKFDLVLSPQFLIIVFLMLVAYVFLSLGSHWANFLGFGIYGAIGLIMFTVPIKQ
jgi:hypothetical protein